jgi:hypothetical protein
MCWSGAEQPCETRGTERDLMVFLGRRRSVFGWEKMWRRQAKRADAHA